MKGLDLMIRKIAIFGGKGGGSLAAQIILNIARATGDCALAGYLNDREPIGSAFHGGKVLAGFDAWRSLDPEIRFLAPLHKAGHMQANAARIRGLDIPTARWASLLDPAASVADDFEIGEGSVVGAFACVFPKVAIGSHCFLRPGAVVGHDVTIGDFVYLGPTAVVCGYCRIGEGVHIAPGAVLRDGVSVGPFAVIGLGAVVIKDVPAYTVVAGNPARVVRH